MDASSDTTGAHPIAQDLLAWYDVHARELPWRAAPGQPAPEPYRVWLSEVMLQQTTVGAVKSYFEAFTTRWPKVEDLAAAADEAVMAAWAGLGYYARARNLLACAREVAQRGGQFPDTEDALRSLPGLGAYTAAAVAAIAFGQRAVVVDANVERVVARLFEIETPMPTARAEIRVSADVITPCWRAGDFAQAMMDLGATVCTSRNPKCLICPLAAYCKARVSGEPERLPVKAPKKTKSVRKGHAFWIERSVGGKEQVWLIRRENSGLLGGMRALPDDGWTARVDGHGTPPLSGTWDKGGKVDHVFTHFALELSLAVYQGGDLAALEDGEWWPLDQLEEAGLPTVFAKVARLGAAMEREG